MVYSDVIQYTTIIYFLFLEYNCTIIHTRQWQIKLLREKTISVIQSANAKVALDNCASPHTDVNYHKKINRLDYMRLVTLAHANVWHLLKKKIFKGALQHCLITCKVDDLAAYSPAKMVYIQNYRALKR